MENLDPKTVANNFYETYNTRDLAKGFSDFISPELVNKSLGGVYSREDWLQTDSALIEACADYKMTMVEQVAEGDKVVSHCKFEGTHTADFLQFPASGNKIYLEVVAIDVVENGKITEHLGVGEFGQFFMQFLKK